MQYNSVKGKLRPLHDTILAVKMEKGEHATEGGVIIPDDNNKERGIRYRWCVVFDVGPKQEDVAPGDYIMVEHGRWTRGLPYYDPEGNAHYLQKIDPKGIMAKSKEAPKDWIKFELYNENKLPEEVLEEQNKIKEMVERQRKEREQQILEQQRKRREENNNFAGATPDRQMELLDSDLDD